MSSCLLYLATVGQPSSSSDFGTDGSAIASFHFFSATCGVQFQVSRPNLSNLTRGNVKHQPMCELSLIRKQAKVEPVSFVKMLDPIHVLLSGLSSHAVAHGRGFRHNELAALPLALGCLVVLHNFFAPRSSLKSRRGSCGSFYSGLAGAVRNYNRNDTSICSHFERRPPAGSGPRARCTLIQHTLPLLTISIRKTNNSKRNAQLSNSTYFASADNQQLQDK